MQHQDVTEERRLAALSSTGLFGTPPEADFDEIVKLASTLCGVPISAMTLLDRESQFIKSAVGLPVGSMPRASAFCDYTVRMERVFTVPDTHADERFVANPLVTGDPNVRFYSGVPLQTEDGSAVGALCVLDTEPRVLTAEQAWSLDVLARQLSARVQLRARMHAAEEQARRMEEQRELLRLFLDSLPIEAYLKAESGELLFYNRAMAEHFGISAQDWLGKTNYDLVDKAKADMLRLEDEYVLRSGKCHESYVELDISSAGPEYWKLIKAPLRLQNGEQMLSAVAINLTNELKREAELVKLQEALEDANRKLRSLSLTDDLTGLWNRRAFDSRLEMEIYEADYGRAPLTLLLLDVDNFKSLNDTFGHSYGDEVLQEVGAVLRRAARLEDVSVRYGGEEFAVIMPGADAAGGQALCKRIATLLDAVRWEHRRVTVSIGIVTHRPGVTSDALLNMADEAMYRAKRNGKNCALVYEGQSA
ncbi:diguanylate cyclase [Terriglobus sp.]|uniref:sensor domain-containing diguanylate cyclase n=1 Tax=Terriglobus sp. TaxID=1889013 RepID=UPI003B00CDDE